MEINQLSLYIAGLTYPLLAGVFLSRSIIRFCKYIFKTDTSKEVIFLALMNLAEAMGWTFACFNLSFYQVASKDTTLLITRIQWAAVLIFAGANMAIEFFGFREVMRLRAKIKESNKRKAELTQYQPVHPSKNGNR